MESENNVIDFWLLNYIMLVFLIGILFVDRDDCVFCKRFLERLGGEKNFEDMIVVLEIIWVVMDCLG